VVEGDVGKRVGATAAMGVKQNWTGGVLSWSGETLGLNSPRSIFVRPLFGAIFSSRIRWLGTTVQRILINSEKFSNCSQASTMVSGADPRKLWRPMQKNFFSPSHQLAADTQGWIISHQKRSFVCLQLLPFSSHTQSIWQQCKLSGILGITVHPVWHTCVSPHYPF
jgi:hypothetical protein